MEKDKLSLDLMNNGNQPRMDRMESRGRLSSQWITKLKVVLVLTSTYLVAEVIGALATGSLALLADAGHMLTDVGGLALALFAISFARKPGTPRRTYGFYRMEILASLANSVVLVLLSVYIFYEAYRRFLEPPEIQSFSMTIVAAIGLAVNLVGMKLLGYRGHSHSRDDTKTGDHKEQHINASGIPDEKKQEAHSEVESLNIEGARLEVLSDMLGSIGVIAAGVIIMLTNFYLIDPIVSIGLGLFILPRTWSLINKSIHILMEGVPANISYEEVRNAILSVRGVTGLFDLHIWTITSGMDALSAHVVVIDPGRAQEILQEINSVLEKRFGIAHSTIQIENYHPQLDSTFKDV